MSDPTALLKNEKQTTPPTLLNTPSGETTPGASTSVESKVFAALIVSDVRNWDAARVGVHDTTGGGDVHPAISGHQQTGVGVGPSRQGK